MDKIHNISFTSRYNPIKPFTIRTKEGKIYVSETSVEKALTPKFVDKINRFIIKNMSEATNYEFYTKYKTGTLKERREVEEICRAHLLEVFNDTKLKNNITLLLAKDNKNRLQGICMSYPNVEMDSIEDTLYIGSLAVNKKYRKSHIGTRLLNATINANRNSFTDVFLTANVRAKRFFSENGFSTFNEKNEVENFILGAYSEVKEYAIPLTMPLQTDKPRWYEKFKLLARNVWSY